MENPDFAHILTDHTLSLMEKRIESYYKEAADDLSKTVNGYFEQFKDRDEKMKSQMENGEITEQHYKQWRLAQIGRGKRFVALRDKVAERYTKATETAIAYVNDKTPGIYSLNRNFTAYTIEKVCKNVDFTLFDERTVKRLIVKQPDLMPHYPPERAVQRGIDLKYGKQQITASVTSSILQGKSIGKIADDLQSRIQDMNRVSAIRAARTATTAAECAGRLDSYLAAKDMGIAIRQEWVATLDGRTRHAHAAADGQVVDVDKPFVLDGYHLMYPGDSSAPGYLVYNCRCTTVAVVDDVDTGDAMRRARDPETGQNVLVEDMTYDEWVKRKKTIRHNIFNLLTYKGIVDADTIAKTEMALSKIPEKQRTTAESAISHIEIVESNIDSGYEPSTGTIYLSLGAPSFCIVHEYAHALERALKIYNDPKFIAIRKKGFENISIRDIIIDDETFSQSIYRVENKKLISLYQGRLYEECGIYDGKNVSISGMLEYFSEGYREFYENPENLKMHDPDLYEYIKGL